MKLNRTHALLLVGTIAAAGCVVEKKDGDGGAGEGGEGSGAKGGTAGSGTSGSAGSWAGKGGSAGKAGSSSTAGKAGSSSYAGTSSVAGAGGEAGSEAGAGGVTSEGGAGGEAGATECNDLDAVAVTCEGFESSSCSISSFLDDECALTWQVMKPRVSNLARECMIGLKATAICDATNTYDCIDTALQAACPDETVTADCDAIIVSCAAEDGPVLSAETCSSYLSGLNEAGRYQMVSCMTGSTYCDFHTCAEGLAYPSAE